ncbi:MAG: cupin domain-containing protein [Planctomycetota bacterium]|jgi:mannose-6-phosphate isomerase-like protein (cupin superfamily)
MEPFNTEDKIDYKVFAGHKGGRLLDENHGAVNGFVMGISEYETEEYGDPGVHDDQEGFYVLAGSGMAKVGDSEFPIKKGSAFIAPKGVEHIMKKEKGSEPLKVLWSHGAV